MDSENAAAFDLAAFLVASARDSLEATPAYGALRLLQAVARLVGMSDDEFVRELAGRAVPAADLLMEDESAFRAALDEMLVLVATEARRRNVGTRAREKP